MKQHLDYTDIGELITRDIMLDIAYRLAITEEEWLTVEAAFNQFLYALDNAIDTVAHYQQTVEEKIEEWKKEWADKPLTFSGYITEQLVRGLFDIAEKTLKGAIKESDIPTLLREINYFLRYDFAGKKIPTTEEECRELVEEIIPYIYFGFNRIMWEKYVLREVFPYNFIAEAISHLPQEEQERLWEWVGGFQYEVSRTQLDRFHNQDLLAQPLDLDKAAEVLARVYEENIKNFPQVFKEHWAKNKGRFKEIVKDRLAEYKTLERHFVARATVAILEGLRKIAKTANMKQIDKFFQSARKVIQETLRMLKEIRGSLYGTIIRNANAIKNRLNSMISKINSLCDEIKKNPILGTVAWQTWLFGDYEPGILQRIVGWQLTPLLMRLHRYIETLEREETGVEAPMDRLKASQEFLERVREMDFNGRSIDEINRELKEELIRVLGGESVAIVLPISPGAEEKFDTLIDKVVERWVKGKGDAKDARWRMGLAAHLLSNLAEKGWIIPPTEESAKVFTEKLAENLSSYFRSTFPVDKAQLFNIVNNALKEAGLLPPGREISPERLSTFLFGIDSIIGEIRGIRNRAGGVIVVYITTKLEDFAKLGTNYDQNPNSCFWKRVGAHSIPSIILASNLAAGFAFHFRDVDWLLKRSGGKDTFPATFEELYNHPKSERIGRFFILVDVTGKIKVAEANRYFAGGIYEGVGDAVAQLIEQRFKGIKVEPTKFLFEVPAV